MLDENCKPYLLEVNHAPSFATDSPLDANPNRKLVARTKLKNAEGFLKFSSDRLTVAWKLQIGV